MKVTGKNVVVFIEDGGILKLYACATSCNLNLATDVIETSGPGDGKFATFLPTRNSFTGSLEGVMTLGEGSMLSLADLRTKQINQTILFVKFQRTAGVYTYISEGNFIITSSEDTGSHADMNFYSVNLQGTGPLFENVGNSEYIPFTYYYGSTLIDTVIVPGHGTFPGRTAFVASVDDVFTAGDELTGVADNTGDNVRVVLSGGSVDRVYFLQMPPTEANFTMWSEQGNALQQNQPIDSSFNFLSGNVWFRTTRGSEILYMTYPATFFTGAIIFSR